jgi:glutamyl-tRNA reductase
VNGSLLALGVSHKTAPLSVRERLALSEGRATGVLGELVAHPEIREAVAISTCNRTELHLFAGDPVEAESVALAALARQAGLPPTELLGHLYALRGLEAAGHLFAVTGGLDSMIVGEAEVQGQVKRAYELALVEGATGPVLNRLFRDALAAGKRVRTETAIGRSHVSVASVAVELAKDTLGDLGERRVLVVGAGGNGELIAQALGQAGVRTVFVANRHYDRAIGLAKRFGGHAVRLDDLPAELASTDIVLTSTASPHQILGREELALVMDQREGRRLLLIDIAVPRDIEPSVRDLAGVTLFDMDDLQREVARNLSGREAEAARARTLLGEEIARFGDWVASLDVVPTIAALRARGDEVVERVLAENGSRWESLSAADRERVEMVARTVVRRLLHEPTLRLKRGVGDERGYAHVQAVRDLFGLEETFAADGDAAAAEVTSLEARRHTPRRP